MERPYRIAFPQARWPWLQTMLRMAFTFFLIGAFFAGSSVLSLGFVAMLGVANALAILLAYELSIRDTPVEWIAGGIFALTGSSLIAYGAWMATRPPAPAGPLLPANEPAPRATCVAKLGPKDLVMAFGANRVVGTGPGPFSPIKVGECAVIKLRRVGQGLMVKAFFYDFNNDVAFSVNDNVYEATMPLQLRPFRPDPHTVVVLDRFDQEVLYVRYLNPNAVRIRGRFLCGESPQAVIHDDAIMVGGIRIGGVFLRYHFAKDHACARLKSGADGVTVNR